MKHSTPALAPMLSSLALLIAGCASAPATSRSVEHAIAPAQEAGYVQLSLRDPEEAVHAQCMGAVLCLGTCAPGDGHCRATCEAPAQAHAAFRLATLRACDRSAGCDGEGSCVRARCAEALAGCTGMLPSAAN